MSDPSKSSSGSIHRIPTLKGTENFNTWRIQMEDILTDLDLYGHVDRSTKCPDPIESTMTVTPPVDSKGKQPPDETIKLYDNTKVDEWKKTDRKVLSRIRLRVEGHVLTHIQRCSTSAEAWELLASTFHV